MKNVGMKHGVKSNAIVASRLEKRGPFAVCRFAHNGSWQESNEVLTLATTEILPRGLRKGLAETKQWN